MRMLTDVNAYVRGGRRLVTEELADYFDPA